MRQNASYLMLKDYFQKLVEKSEFLHDFVGYFSRELHNKEESIKGIKSPFLVLFNYQIGIEGEEMATSTAVRNISIGVLKNDVPADDYEAQYQAIDEMENFGLKIMSRLRYDSHLQGHFLYGALIKNSIEIRPVEAGVEGYFGVEISFQLKNPQSLKLNPEDWKDIDKIC